MKQRIWLVNFSSALFVEFNFFKFWLALFYRWNQGAHLHFISHAHAVDVIRRQLLYWYIPKYNCPFKLIVSNNLGNAKHLRTILYYHIHLNSATISRALVFAEWKSSLRLRNYTTIYSLTIQLFNYYIELH